MAEIFRKEALERRATPDKLDDYIKVSNPSVWLVLGAIVLFLAGLGIWCIFGTIADVQTGIVTVEGGTATLVMDQTAAGELNTGDKVEVSGVTGTVVAVSPNAIPLSSLDSNTREELAAKSSWVSEAAVSIDLPDGTYPADVTVATIDPIQLLLDRS